jgi:hypothetical protein
MPRPAVNDRRRSILLLLGGQGEGKSTVGDLGTQAAFPDFPYADAAPESPCPVRVRTRLAHGCRHSAPVSHVRMLTCHTALPGGTVVSCTDGSHSACWELRESVALLAHRLT